MKKSADYDKGMLKGIILSVVVLAGIYFGFNVFGNFANENADAAKKLESIRKLLDTNYVGEIDYSKLDEGIFYGYVDAIGDPYTTYMSKNEIGDFMEDIQGSFYGVGVLVTENKNDELEVISTLEDTPAEEAGLTAGDVITGINGSDISDIDALTAINMIKGDKGTKVTLSIYRGKEDRTFDAELTRMEIDVPSVRGEMLPGDIAYIKISQFNKNTYDQFVKEYDRLKNEGRRGLVIDLRNNLGGRFDVVQKITDILVPEGVMVYTVDKKGEKTEYKSDANAVDVPLILLVNEYTASASEILSGAVKEMGAGVLVGTRTYGKGLVQGLFLLDDGSAVKITVQKYYTPKGTSIQGIGITPDYVVRLPESFNASTDIDPQLQKALELLE